MADKTRMRFYGDVYKLIDLCICLYSNYQLGNLSISRDMISAYCANEDPWIEIYSMNFYIKTRTPGRKCDTFIAVTEYCWCGIA